MYVYLCMYTKCESKELDDVLHCIVWYVLFICITLLEFLSICIFNYGGNKDKSAYWTARYIGQTFQNTSLCGMHV